MERLKDETFEMKCCRVVFQEMESGDGIELEPEKGTLETDPKANGFMSNINKDDEVSDSGDAVQADGDSSVDEPKVTEVDYPGEGNEGSVSATAIKDSNLPEVFTFICLFQLLTL